MEAKIFLDTHVIIWLYAGEIERISKKARTLLETATLQITPMCLLEIDYLFETKKITVRSQPILRDLSERIDLQVSHSPFIEIVREASQLYWTRDPFDRLIVAQARLHKAPLLTKDRNLKKHYPLCVW